MLCAGRRRIFFQHEVQLASDDLERAELAMKKVQEKTGVLMLEPQAEAMLQGVAGLQAHINAGSSGAEASEYSVFVSSTLPTRQ